MRLVGGIAANVSLTNLVAAPVTQDVTATQYLRTIAALYGFDGTDLRRVLVESTTNPNIRASLYVAGNQLSSRLMDGSDIATTAQGLVSAAPPYLWNQSNFERVEGHGSVTLLTSGGRSATTSSADQTHQGASGVLITWNVTAAGTGTLTLTVAYRDPVSNGGVNLLVSPGITTTGRRAYLVQAGAGGANDDIIASRGTGLPRVWLVTITHSDGSLWTYSVGCSYLA